MTLACAGTVSACNAISGIGDFSVTAAISDDGATPFPDRDGGSTTPFPEDPPDGNVTTDDAGHEDTGSEDTGTSPDDASTNPDTGTEIEDSGSDSSTTPTSKRVFVTYASAQGNFGSSSGGQAFADSVCAQAASNAKLGGAWIAWLSTLNVSAISRIPSNGPFVRLDGALVAATKNDLLSGSIANPINIAEDKGKLTSSTNEPWVWTGTAASTGQHRGYTCTDWTTNGPLVYGVIGNFSATNNQWTDQGSPFPGFSAFGCQSVGHFYCFEK